MIVEEYPIQSDGSMPYARLQVYLWEESEELGIHDRPLILLCPGGGYAMTSDREADPIATRFLAMGYHVGILRYSVAPAVYPTALLEVFHAMKLIREHSAQWHVDSGKIFIQGCSAGGHLAASAGMFWHETWIAEKLGCDSEQLRPAGMILCYPVITSGMYAHRGSFEMLLAGQYTDELLVRNSLEQQVNEHTPQTFLWHTYTDDCVPVENSLLLISAMKKYNVPVEFHMYPEGGHGLSTCDRLAAMEGGYGVQEECQSWIPLVQTWLEKRTWKEEK